MSRRPVDARISTASDQSRDDGTAGLTAQEFREALSYWASGVTVVALRDDGQVHAMTVSSLTSVSADPPTVLVSLSSSARIVPFLRRDLPLGISILADDQRRVASVFADSYPVGPSPFGPDPAPLIHDALVGLTCRVSEIMEVAGSNVVAARVEGARFGTGESPLLYHRREYGTLAE